MSGAHKEPNYMGIFWWLLGLTVLELGATKLPVPHLVIAVLLVGFALAKAALVAMYFMHLRFERRTMAMIALTPLILCLFLALMLLPDTKHGAKYDSNYAKPADTAGAPEADAAHGE